MGRPSEACAQSVVAHLANGYIFPYSIDFFLSRHEPFDSGVKRGSGWIEWVSGWVSEMSGCEYMYVCE